MKTLLAPFEDNVIINIENSSNQRCIRHSMNFLAQSAAPAVLIGKSLGGVRLWWMLRQHAADLALQHSQVFAIFVDPHGWQVGDGIVGTYGKNRDLPYWDIFDAFNFVNFYQHNKWPHGAVFKGQGFNQSLGPDADHWNITDFRSKRSEPVRQKILQTVESFI